MECEGATSVLPGLWDANVGLDGDVDTMRLVRGECLPTHRRGHAKPTSTGHELDRESNQRRGFNDNHASTERCPPLLA